MKVSIIGSGNVATVMATLLVKAGHTITEVCSRNPEHAAVLAAGCAASVAGSLQLLSGDADLYLVAVSDTAIPEVAADFPHRDKLVVHTAGPVAKNELAPTGNRFGVLYPLQTLRKELTYIPEIPFLVDGNTPEVVSTIRILAESLSSTVIPADDAQRKHLHLAAVVVSNFTNHLYTLAAGYCTDNAVPFSVLHPLVLETAQRLQHFSPASMQTGPAVRNDSTTIESHLVLLQQFPALQKLYIACTESIQEYYKPGREA